MLLLSADEFLSFVGCKKKGRDDSGDVVIIAAGGVVARGGVISAGKVCKGLNSHCSSSEAEELTISLSSQKTLSLLTMFGGSSSW